jgi:hypothetical protein
MKRDGPFEQVRQLQEIETLIRERTSELPNERQRPPGVGSLLFRYPREF